MHSRSSLIDELYQKIEANLTNPQFGVEELAAAVGMSRSNLHRKLQNATGQSVSQFIREYRLQKARELLLNEDLTASEVAHQVGFSSATYFSKAYHDYYGYPPGETRKKANDTEGLPLRNRNKTARIYVAVGLIVLVFGFSLFYMGDEEKVSSADVEKSIAVLPFKNLSADDENQYFADGVMEAILNKLAAVGDLKVISRTSVEKYRENSNKNIQEIAEELNVNYILEGSGQKYNDEVRITVQLINASSDKHLWSNEYTRKFEGVLQLQNEIAQYVASELKTTLSNEDQKQLTALYTHSAEAYNYHLQGNFQLNKWTEEGLKNAIPLFEKAIALDSNFVEPYVGLANVYQTGGSVWGIFDQTKAGNESKRLLLKALKIDKNNAEVHNTIQGNYFYYQWDLEKSFKHQERCKALTGQYGNLSMDFFLKTGGFQKALDVAQYNIDKDPANSTNYFFTAEALYFLGKKQQAIAILDSTYRLHSDFFFLREAVKLYYLYEEIEKSYKALVKLKRIYPDRPPIVQWFEAVHAIRRDEDPAPFIDQLKEKHQANSSGSPAWFIALYHAERGNRDKLFEWLEKSYQRHEVEMTWLKMEPTLNPYKDDPRYLDLMERVGFL